MGGISSTTRCRSRDPGTKAKRIMAGNNKLGASGGPKPGEGPSKEAREAGYFDLLFVGIAPDGRQVRVGVRGDRDRG